MDIYGEMLGHLDATRVTLTETLSLLVQRGDQLAQLETKSNDLANASRLLDKTPRCFAYVRACVGYIRRNGDFIIRTLACCGAFEDE